MSKSTTPAHVVKVTLASGAYSSPMAWPTKYAGKANAKNLAKWVDAYNASMKPGGVNAHLNDSVLKAVLKKNGYAGEVVATWAAPAATIIVAA